MALCFEAGGFLKVTCVTLGPHLLVESVRSVVDEAWHDPNP